MGFRDVDPTFRWDATHDVLAQWPDLVVDTPRRGFVGPDETGQTGHVTVPLLQPIDDGIVTARQFLATLPTDLGTHLVLLMQAGAVSIGWFAGGESLATKTIKKYVVRGRGKAQPTHLATKGKSRYGSRLRLQQAKALLVDTNERLHDWFDEFGTADLVFYNCPVRSWPELFKTRPAPPFAKDVAIKIPFDLPIPTTDTLLRTYKRMGYGRIAGT